MKKTKELVILGNNIKSLRTKKGWSQETLAENCNLDRTYIGSIERGERNVAALNLLKIASALGCSINKLFVDICPHE